LSEEPNLKNAIQPAIAPNYLPVPKRRQHLDRRAFQSPVDRLFLDDSQLQSVLGLDSGSRVCATLRSALFNPIEDFICRRGKRVRAQLVNLGYRLVAHAGEGEAEGSDRLRTCAEIVELLHAGSLIIDDIEDGSSKRRGRPTLHTQHGVPIALNAGNWLYFWPCQLLKRLRLPVEKLNFVYEQYHFTLLRAHFGQALDIGARVDEIPQREIEDVCLASMKLKTGALMGFALSLGGVIAGTPNEALSILDQFGANLGVALQMFDDVGNVGGKREPAKRYEDLFLYRPSWVWAWAARETSAEDFRRFVGAVQLLPETEPLERWLEQHHLIERARGEAVAYLNAVFCRLEDQLEATGVRWSKPVLEELRHLGEEISLAYE